MNIVFVCKFFKRITEMIKKTEELCFFDNPKTAADGILNHQPEKVDKFVVHLRE